MVIFIIIPGMAVIFDFFLVILLRRFFHTRVFIRTDRAKEKYAKLVKDIVEGRKVDIRAFETKPCTMEGYAIEELLIDAIRHSPSAHNTIHEYLERLGCTYICSMMGGLMRRHSVQRGWAL